MAQDEGTANRSGIKTTEFWITLVVSLAGVVTSLGLPDTHIAVKISGVILALAAALGYTWVRGGVKKAQLLVQLQRLKLGGK